MTLAELIMELGARGNGGSTAMRWLAGWLPDAQRQSLGGDDLARIDAVQASTQELRDLLPAVLPLAQPLWLEAATIVGGRTDLVVGYGALPVRDGIDIGFACWAPARQRLLGPLGPARTTIDGTVEPDPLSAYARSELEVAASIVVRAMLIGQRQAMSPHRALRPPPAAPAAPSWKYAH
jgi:hypothetical protein